MDTEHPAFVTPLWSVEVVQTHAALLTAVSSLRSAFQIALDCESNGMHVYEPQLCTLQLAACTPTGIVGKVYVIDTIALTSSELQCLEPLLGTPGPRILVHDVAFDARLLARRGLYLRNVVDTAIHSRLLGHANTGLQSLVESMFRVSLPKHLQSIDWSQRPLTEEHLHYLAHDVLYLGPLAQVLETEAARIEISREIDVESRHLVAAAIEAGSHLRPAEPEHAYLRLRGIRNLVPQCRAVLREIAAVRERIAATVNRPSGRIIPSHLLLRIARECPTTLEHLQSIMPFPTPEREVLDALIVALQRGLERGDVPAEEQALLERPHIDNATLRCFKCRHEALTRWRITESTQRSVVPHVVLPTHVLDRLVRHGARTHSDLMLIPGMGDVRIDRYGTQLLGLLAEADQLAL